MEQVRMYDKLLNVVKRDCEAFSGHALEGYFREKFISEGRYSRMGGWWDRKGENEIDLVCENEFSNTFDFYEVKRDARRIDIAALARKREAFFAKNPEQRSRTALSKGLSILDMLRMKR